MPGRAILNPPEPSPIPERPFDQPWQAQAFALTVALHQAGLFTWPDWAQTLGAELKNAAEDGSDYWDHWLAALAERWQRAARATPHGTPITLEAAR